MNKKDLKTLIKPLVKECIHEVLVEEGLLSNIVAEVAVGLQGTMLTESKQAPPAPTPAYDPEPAQRQAKKAAIAERQKLMDAIGADAYNGVNLFEGTAPMSRHESSGPQAGSVDLGSPADAGVDISSLVGGAGRMWDAMK